jgi:hypothetical protein
MPCPPDVLKRVDEVVDRYLAAKKDEVKQQYFSNNYDITNPLDAPPSGPFYHDSPPTRIRGAGMKDLFG